MDSELLKWGVQQGGLALVIILLIYYIKRRDADIQRVLDSNSEALQSNATSNDNLTRAIDAQNSTLNEHTDALKTLLYGIQRKKVGSRGFQAPLRNPRDPP